MIGAEIIQYFEGSKSLKKHFKGVFASDQVKDIFLKEKTFVVINTDSVEGTGKHWFALFKVSNLTECFDSLGLDADILKKRLESFRGDLKPIVFNESPVQPETSVLCGWFCCYFATARLLNSDLSFEEAEFF
jgi:hypothetical protein